jgi:hypothetical protein
VRRLVAALGVDEAARVALREHLRPDDLLADQPVVAVDHHRDHVGEALVERARLALIDEVDRAAHDRVGELVGRDVERPREALEGERVAVADRHVLVPRVPERVVEVLAVVHQLLDLRALAVPRVAPVGLAEVVDHLLHVIVRGRQRGPTSWSLLARGRQARVVLLWSASKVCKVAAASPLLWSNSA